MKNSVEIVQSYYTMFSLRFIGRCITKYELLDTGRVLNRTCPDEVKSQILVDGKVGVVS